MRYAIRSVERLWHSRFAARLAAAGVARRCRRLEAGWFEALAAEAAGQSRQRRRSCILLWMSGGPSQIDTFDLKPGHANGGPFKEIATSVPGMRISRTSAQAGRAGRTPGHHPLDDQQGRRPRPGDPVRPHRLFAARADPLSDARLAGRQGTRHGRGRAAELRQHRAVPRPQPGLLFGPAFSARSIAPLIVGSRHALAGGEPTSTIRSEGRRPGTARGRRHELADARLDLLQLAQRAISSPSMPTSPAVGHATAYQRAVRLMRSPAGRAFKLDEEPAAVRDAYGRNRFGQGCLLARRLVEQGCRSSK